MATAEVHDQRVAAVLVQRLVQQEDVAHRLGHLRLMETNHAVVNPEARKRDASGRPRLRRLVLVVGENEVRATSMDLEVEAQQPLCHRRALDVPPGTPSSPGGIPRRVLAGLVRLPQREVERVTLQVRAFHLLPLVHVLNSPVR